MVPAGYLLKRISPPSAGLSGASVVDVCSVSDCVNDNVVDVQTAWQHNGFGVANDPGTLFRMAGEARAEIGEAKLFYYEAYEQEIETDGWSIDPSNWRPLTGTPSAGVETSVVPPTSSLTTLGYDVVVFDDYLDHSPVSCNNIAADLRVNEHCLFDTVEDAKAAIDSGAFTSGCEPGVYRIFSVSIVPNLKVPG